MILYYIEVYEKNAQTEPEIKITHFQFHYDNLEISLAFKLTTRSLGRSLVDYELYNLARDYLIDLSIQWPENALEVALRYAAYDMH